VHFLKTVAPASASPSWAWPATGQRKSAEKDSATTATRIILPQFRPARRKEEYRQIMALAVFASLKGMAHRGG
jgi:hypothetical protein